MSILSAIVDSREPAHMQSLALGVDVVVAELPAGDLLAACDDGNLCIFERKTPSDLLGTLRSNRLFPQMERLRRESPFCYLVVTGALVPGPNDTAWADGRETGWSWSSVQGALLTCQEVGVHAAICNGDLDYAPTVLRICNRDRSTVRVAPVRDMTLIDDREAFLSGLPGIGAGRAEALLQDAGSVAWALHYLTTPERLDTPGIGPKTKERARAFLGLRPDESLSPITWDTDGERVSERGAA